MSPKILRLLALLFSLGLVLAACGGDDDADADDESSVRDRDEDDDEDDDDDTTTTTEATGDDREDAIEDFGDDVKDEIGDLAGDDTSYGEYVSVNDDSGFLTVEVPAAWSDVDGSPGLFGPDVIASTDVRAFIETYSVSGLEFQATEIETNQSPDEVLDAVSRGQVAQCTVGARQPYSDPLYTGVSQVFQDCVGSDTAFVWVAFEPADGAYHGVVGVQVTTEADVEALERALNTFIVNA